MSDQSANEAYDLIIQWLRDNDLEWVARQIEEEIVIGKPKHGRISVPKASLIIESGLARRSAKAPTSAEFLAREDYTPHEKCEIAVGALDAVVTGAIKIQDSLLKTLSRKSQNPTITFAPGDHDARGYSFRDSDLLEKRVRATELSELLEELKKQGSMTLNLSLIQKIESILSLAVTPNLTSSSNGDDLYEAYVWSIVIEAAINKGATVEFKDVNGAVVLHDYYFRTSPSELWWNSHNYCHAEIGFANCPTLEVHTGIYVAGKSDVRHECDVAVVHKTEADICRSNHVLPRSSKVLLAVECKYYVNSNPGLGLARGFLGLREEILRDGRFFIATSHSKSVEKLLSKHTRDYELKFTPVIPHNIDVMRGTFETVFAKFKGQHS